MNRLDRFSVSRDDCEAMTLDCDLGWTNRGKGVDHSESVSATGSNGEDFQRSVGHEAGVGVSELSFTVDEEGFGILTSINGQSSWVPFSGVLMQPIADQNNVGCQIKVVEMAVGVS